MFDVDDDNSIDSENLLFVLSNPDLKKERMSKDPNSLMYKVFDGLTEYQIDEMIREVDMEGKGYISREEFM